MSVELRVSPARPAARVVGDVAALDESTRNRRAAYPIALVAMPFVPANRPSAPVGLLGAIAASHGFPVTPLSAYLDFSRLIGAEAYHRLAYGRGGLRLGDWIFGIAAFSDDPDPDCELLELADYEGRLGGLDRDWLVWLREEVAPSFIDELVESIAWHTFGAVCFSSTFEQNGASFALARRIKQHWPRVTTVFGGANFDGSMGPEWVRSMPFIDHAVRGEADRALPLLLSALTENCDVALVPGVLTRRDNEVVCGPQSAPLDALDELPIPDYDEYFARATRLGLLDDISRSQVEIPFESSRGCWWGEKATCTFCGLNGSTIGFRSKSPTRVIDELAELTRRHGSFRYFATDNILDIDYLDAVIDPLAASGTDYWIFYEVKATLDRAQMERLHAGGVRSIQPGVESLSSRILRLMRKGTRAIDNVNVLRWAAHFGIEVHWNFLWGFPGETEDDYIEQARVMRLLHHLEPPSAQSRISLERFSPYFEDPTGFPVRSPGRRPDDRYARTYPSDVDLEAVAYHFDGELEGSLRDEQVEVATAAASAWVSRWARDPRPTLHYWWSPGVLRISDRRSPLAQTEHRFGDPHAAVYVAMSDRPDKPAAVAARVGLEPHEVAAAVDDLCRRGLMLRDTGRCLSLALPGSGPR